ncbi:MAG: phage minor capsid protein [Agromyces sp.]
MPTSPRPERTASDYAATLVALYVLAERDLLVGFTSILRRSELTPGGAYTALPKLHRLIRRILDRLARGDRLAGAMVSAAVSEGAREARRQVGDLRAQLRAAPRPDSRGGSSRGPGDGRPPGRGLALPDDSFFDLSMPHGERAAQAVRDDITSELADVRRRITRLPDDIYKMIAPHGAIYQALENGVTPAQAQAMAWRVFVSQGITGFTDRGGRDWSLSAYVEMAVRTASTRAFNASHLARMLAIGVEYFTVPHSVHPCPKCFPWQGRVITATEIENPVIPVAGTIEQATAAGLFHPNCAHVLIPVYPGITTLEPGVWTPELEREYVLSQRQRAIERDIRKAKRQLEHALTPETRQDALLRVRRQQARMRAFINDTGFARQSRREQTDLTDPRIKLPEPIRN